MIYLLSTLYGVFVFICIYTYRISMGFDLWSHPRMKLVSALMAVVPILNIVILIVALSGIQLQVTKVISIISERTDSDPANPFHEISQPEAEVYHRILNQLS